MEDDLKPKALEHQDQSRLGSFDPRKLSSVPPPPMIVVHRGWWSDRVTERPAIELIEEGRKRRQHR